jgi:uncharacterized protein (TIGR02453 family)
MFNGFSEATIDFLWGIRFNNDRDWFSQHKQEYQEHLYQSMLELAEAVRQQYTLPGTILKTSRIYRDVRYSKGIPYKDHLWFCIREDNVFWSEHPSMYFQIEPEGGSCGFIFYAPKAALMEAHRKQLLKDPKPFLKVVEPILADGRFTDRSTLYKRPKPGQTEELLPWYQLKNCYFEQEIPLGDALFSEKLPQQLADSFRTLEPLYHYFGKLEASIEA